MAARRVLATVIAVTATVEGLVRAEEPPSADAIADWVQALGTDDVAKRNAAAEALQRLGPESREAFDAAVAAAQGDAATRAAKIRKEGLLGSLERNDAERLLGVFWEKDAERVTGWYRARFPQLREAAPGGRAVELLKAGGEATKGDGGTVIWSRTPEEVGERDRSPAPGGRKVRIDEGQFGLVVRTGTHTWFVVVGTLDGAAFLADCDGTRTVDKLAGERDVRDLVHALLGLTFAEAVTWSEKPGEAAPGALRDGLRAIGRAAPKDGILARVFSCFRGE